MLCFQIKTILVIIVFSVAPIKRNTKMCLKMTTVRKWTSLEVQASSMYTHTVVAKKKNDVK